jgi:hypothetical protein
MNTSDKVKDDILNMIVERKQGAGFLGKVVNKLTGRTKGRGEEGAGSPDAGSVGQVKGSKKIESLAPNAQPKFREFIKKANAAGYTIKITSARRVPSHQWNLKYKGGGITPASPCRSDHQYGYALDINASYKKDGKTKNIMSKSSDAQWKPIVDIAKSVGLKWQGAKDRVHFYLKGVPGSTKDQCKDFYVSNLGSLNRGTGSKAMKALEQDPTKNAAIKKILDLPNIEIFAEDKVKDDILNMIIERKQGAGFLGKVVNKLTGGGKEKRKGGPTGIGHESVKTMDSLAPEFRSKVAAVFSELKGKGLNPGLGSGWRSPEDQIKKFKTGKSKVKIGTHSNVDPASKKPASWAADVVQKGVGWASTTEAFDFFVALGEAAHNQGLVWGGDWSPKKKKIQGKEYTIGWDPAHIEWEPASNAQVKSNLKKVGVDVDALAIAESVRKTSTDDILDTIIERKQEAGLGAKRKARRAARRKGSADGGCAWNKGSPANISPDWKQKTLIDVISGGGKSKKFDDVIPLDGGSIGIAHWAAGGLEQFLKANPDAPQPPGGARDCRETEGGKIASGKNASQSKPGCYLEPGTKKPNTWVSKIKKWLGSNRQKQIDHWNKTKADKPGDLAKTWGWNTSRHMAIAAGISNSLGTGGFKKLAKANGLHPEKTLSAYGAMSDHKKRRQDRINKVFGCVTESSYLEAKSETIKDLYSEIIFEINEALLERNHRSLIEMWKPSGQNTRDWDYKNMLSHEDFMHMATIDLKNSLVAMKRRGATKDDMIDALEQILRDIKSGSVTTPDVRIV